MHSPQESQQRRKRKLKEQDDGMKHSKPSTRKRELLPGCKKEICLKRCHEKFSYIQRQEIMTNIWKQDFTTQKLIIKHLVSVTECKETKSQTSRKSKTRTYRLRLDDGEHNTVCQRFFLDTLGVQANNDKIIRTAFQDVKDQRGSRRPVHKIDHELVYADIER